MNDLSGANDRRSVCSLAICLFNQPTLERAEKKRMATSAETKQGILITIILADSRVCISEKKPGQAVLDELTVMGDDNEGTLKDKGAKKCCKRGQYGGDHLSFEMV